ncbi:hypothetical protein GCM10023080_032660 [Streptomyces pseudoechinosporeus]
MSSVTRTIGTIAVAALLVGGGFAAGRLTAPELDTTTSDCEDARGQYQEFKDNPAPAGQDVDETRLNSRMIAHTVLESTDCFSASDRAYAQTVLDMIDQGIQQDE